MSYRLEPDETLPEGIRRIAQEQIDEALGHLRNPGDDLDEAVHESRKCFKKVRGLLRLIRLDIGEDVYQRENVCFRDAGRRLSDLRDSVVRINTLDDLAEKIDEPDAEEPLAEMRAALVIFYNGTRQRVVEEEEGLVAAADMVAAARQRIPDWPIGEDRFETVRGGLRKVYKRGRNRLADAEEDPTSETFHEWRKRVKYLWYDVRILRPIWPDMMATLATEIHDLSDYLGDEHDLAELRDLVLKQEELSLLPREDVKELLLSTVKRERSRLQAAAYCQGKRIYPEKPDQFVDRFGAYWAATRT